MLELIRENIRETGELYQKNRFNNNHRSVRKSPVDGQNYSSWLSVDQGGGRTLNPDQVNILRVGQFRLVQKIQPWHIKYGSLLKHKDIERGNISTISLYLPLSRVLQQRCQRFDFSRFQLSLRQCSSKVLTFETLRCTL